MSGGLRDSDGAGMRFLMTCLLGAATGALAVCLAAGSVDAEAVAAVTQAEIRAAPAGTLLRVWPLAGGTPAGSIGYRVLYRSTGYEDRPIAVSGAVIVPTGSPPDGGRDIVAWAHPTTGVDQSCSPTLRPDLAASIPGLDAMLARGYVVAATDYDGLGSPGVHAYLNGRIAAQTVLDSVRAARLLSRAQAGRRFVVWGHSQGGHAALFAGERAAAYAPELLLLGIAAAAPATDLIELFKADRGSLGGSALTAMALSSWSKLYRLPLDRVVEAAAEMNFRLAAQDCILSYYQIYQAARHALPLQREFLRADPTEIEPWRSIMSGNTPGRDPVNVPILISQGTGDDLVLPAITQRFVQRLCQQGERVTYHVIRGGSHGFAAFDSADTTIRWLDERFAGHKVPAPCE
jgi:pimeloyl-ACP methyl ester carboxylesterase